MVNIKSIVLYIFVSIIIIIIFHFICSLLQNIIIFIYEKLQFVNINKCYSNYKVFEKLIILNYKVYIFLINFLVIIDPVKTNSCSYKKEYFKLKLVSHQNKKTIEAFLLYSIFLIIILKYDAILTKIKGTDIINTIKTILHFMNNNKWYILFFIGIASFIYNIYKSKYTNKIIEKIQDEELLKVIEKLQKISLELFSFEKLLLKNIKYALSQATENNTYVFLYREIEKRFDFCTYSFSENKLVLKDDQQKYEFDFCVRFNCVNSSIERIKKLCDEYQKNKSFYNLYDIDKYVPKLKSFDIELLIKEKNKIIGKETIERLIDLIIADAESKLEIYKSDKLSFVDYLNKQIKSTSETINETILDSIDTAMEIDQFIRAFNKAMSLKKYRNEISIDKFLSNIK